MGYFYSIVRGAFCVARFDNQGNAKAFMQWNGQQDWLHVFYVSWCKTQLLTRSLQGAWPHKRITQPEGDGITEAIRQYNSEGH
jgi:hypothetical protein